MSRPTHARSTILDDLGSASRNIFCRSSDLDNEASVETFFVSRLLKDLGYADKQIKTKHSLTNLTVGRGSRLEKYKPDYALFYRGAPRCIVDAKGTGEDLNDWVEQCSGYCLALNRKYKNRNPVRFFVLSNGLSTVVYEWDMDEALLSLDFSDFAWGNPRYEHLKRTLGPRCITTATAEPPASEAFNFKFSRATTSRAKRLFSTCHKVIWKSEGYGPGPAFLAFVKLMFVKLWADQNLRSNHTTKNLFDGGLTDVMLPRSPVIFSEHWVEQRHSEGVENPINDMFIQLRKEIEKDIELRKKKRIFTKDEELGLRPDTVLDIVRRLEHIDLFGIDEDLNGRLFETFLNATMRGRDLGQFFTPRSVVKMMTDVAALRVTREQQDKVMDGCCGSGGFLIEALTVMRNKVRENSSLSAHEQSNLIQRIANDRIYGVDYGKDPPLARIARINMYLHGDGGSRIYYADGLDKALDDSAMADPEIIQNMRELRSALVDEEFDVVLTNPPFSMTKEAKNPSEKRILEQYTLAKRSETTSSLRPSLRSSVMFLERYFDVLRPGGRLITVIDETLLSSAGFSYVRDFVRKSFLIRAIISLPGDTFRRSGSRVKTSILFLEKKKSKDDVQPRWFYFFAEYIGLDNLNTKASEQDVAEAHHEAEREAERIVTGFRGYMNGDDTTNVLGPDRIMDRLDLRNCVPMFGRMADNWKASGVSVKRLIEVVSVVDEPLRPSEHPDDEFILVKVSYGGNCEVEGQKQGRRIRAATMQKVTVGQIVFSTIRATDGAIGIVPPELDGALVSGSYTVFRCDVPHDTAYLWSVLRSHELRADMQSLSPGSGRYTTYWPGAGQLLVPWPSEERRKEIGDGLIDLWRQERELNRRRQRALAHLDALGVESEASRKRWLVSKAPQ